MKRIKAIFAHPFWRYPLSVISRTVALAISAWLNKYQHTTRAISGIMDDINEHQGNLEALSRRLGAQEELGLEMLGRLRFTMVALDLWNCTSHWDEVAQGMHDDQVLRGWRNQGSKFWQTLRDEQHAAEKLRVALGWDGMIYKQPGIWDRKIKTLNVLTGISEEAFKSFWNSGHSSNAADEILRHRPLLFKALEMLESIQKTLAMEAGKSMRLATHQAQIANAKDEAKQLVDALAERVDRHEQQVARDTGYKFYQLEALVHIMGLELRENGQPHNVEAWRSKTRNQDADAMLALESYLGIKASFDEAGQFTGYEWANDTGQLQQEWGNPGAGLPVIDHLHKLYLHMADTDKVFQSMPSWWECPECNTHAAIITASHSGTQNGNDVDIDCLKCLACGTEWSD